MQTESYIFDSHQDRCDLLRDLELMLCRGKPEDAFAQAIELAGNLCDRHGNPIGLADFPLEKVRLEMMADLQKLLRSGRKITAISFDLSWPGHFGQKCKPTDMLDESGALNPIIETVLYQDKAYPFTSATREDFVISRGHGNDFWRGDFVHIDTRFQITGMGHQYGLVQQQSAIRDRNPEEEDAYQINAAICAIAAHLGVKRTLQEEGLPCALAILTDSNEDFPFFGAPVVTFEESRKLVREPEKKRPRPQTKTSRTRKSSASGTGFGGGGRNRQKNGARGEAAQASSGFEMPDEIRQAYETVKVVRGVANQVMKGKGNSIVGLGVGVLAALWSLADDEDDAH